MSHFFHSKGGFSTPRQNYDRFEPNYNIDVTRNKRFAVFSKLSSILSKCRYVILVNNSQKFLNK